MRKILGFFLIFISITILPADSGHIRHTIIIDTDGAADDLRTITMLLASPEIKTLAITTSDGALSPKEGLVKVRALLKEFYHEGIPTGIGMNTQSEVPPWRKLSQNIMWGDEATISANNAIAASELMARSIIDDHDQVTVVCLGSLTNIAKAMKNTNGLKDKIKRILWYNNNIHPNYGTNYDIDRLAGEYVLLSGVDVDVVTPHLKEIAFSETLLTAIEEIPTKYAQKIATRHRDANTYKMISSGHFKLWDDLVALYLLNPEYFKTNRFPHFQNHTINHLLPDTYIANMVCSALNGKTNEQGIIFQSFPLDTEYYREDVEQFKDRIISAHGNQEWKIVVMTNEFHDHLGIYSIVGAKMGLRAREYFNLGRDELYVTSFAGDKPPISCLNDGLQVSTGATIGQGTIQVYTIDLMQKPKAVFSYHNSTISIELKPEYWQYVRDDIKECIKSHGALTDGYWKVVRGLAIRYWLEWSRYNIFDIEVIQSVSDN